jgi:hypothetical protein
MSAQLSVLQLVLLQLLLLLIVGDVNAQVASSAWLSRVVPLIDDVGRRAVQMGVRREMVIDEMKLNLKIFNSRCMN